MRNIRGILLIFTVMMFMSGCSKSCKVDGCTMAIFKDDVCEAHYTVMPGSTEAEESAAQGAGTETKSIEIISDGTEAASQNVGTAPKETAAESALPENQGGAQGESRTGSREVNSSADYLLPESGSRHYTAEELSALTSDELRLARNEIYARHGRKFTDSKLQAYFSAKTWYTPVYEAAEFDKKSDSLLNEYEKANRALIVSLEDGGAQGAIGDPQGGINDPQGGIGDPAVDYKGNYQLKGGEYVWVDTYYMRDRVLYIEGTYCDGVWNPDAEVAGDSMTFTTIKEHVTIVMDSKTKLTLEGCKELKDVTSRIDSMIHEFGETAVEVKLDGNHVTEFSGTWQWS